MNVKIHSIHFRADGKLEQYIREKLSKVEQLVNHVIDSQVILKLDHNNGAVKDKVAEIKLQLPGKILVARQTSLSFEESVETAAAAIVRQVKKHKQKIQQ